MIGVYAGRYGDQFGSEDIVVHNDGSELRVEIRGVVCVGSDCGACKRRVPGTGYRG